MKRNNVRPMFATRLRFVIEAAGKMEVWNPGMRPMTDGPRMIPPIISDMTLGWRILERGQFSARQKMMIIEA